MKKIKISNNHTAYYSRLFAKDFPQYAGIFKYKPVSEEKQLEMFEKTKVEKFNEFHREHPEIYELYKRITFDEFEKGNETLSSKLIIEKIRWQIY